MNTQKRTAIDRQIAPKKRRFLMQKTALTKKKGDGIINKVGSRCFAAIGELCALVLAGAYFY